MHEREGYAVSAGFALGLVALGMVSNFSDLANLMFLLTLLASCVNEGRGQDAIGSTDTLVDRLFHYIGGKDLHNVYSVISQLK